MRHTKRISRLQSIRLQIDSHKCLTAPVPCRVSSFKFQAEPTSLLRRRSTPVRKPRVSRLLYRQERSITLGVRLDGQPLEKQGLIRLAVTFTSHHLAENIFG